METGAPIAVSTPELLIGLSMVVVFVLSFRRNRLTAGRCSTLRSSR